jgi:hypothetical protein
VAAATVLDHNRALPAGGGVSEARLFGRSTDGSEARQHQQVVGYPLRDGVALRSAIRLRVTPTVQPLRLLASAQRQPVDCTSSWTSHRPASSSREARQLMQPSRDGTTTGHASMG